MAFQTLADNKPHVGLLDAIRCWCVQHGERACFVTFNYDTFVEQAFRDSTLKIGIRELDDYISNDTYKVIKLHGSVTWFHEVVSPVIDDVEQRSEDDIMRELITRAEEVKPTKGFRVEVRTTIGKAAKSGLVVIPAIAIPVQQKPDPGFECPDKHVEVLKACIPSVTKLMLIGWAGKEKAFLEMLKALPKDTDVVVVGENQTDAEEIAGELNDQGIPCSFKASAARGFSKFVEEREADAFLAR